MTRVKIIKRLRKRHKLEEMVRQASDKVNDAIQEMQGDPKQETCTHGMYGNGYIYHTDVCSECWKILTTEDKERFSAW